MRNRLIKTISHAIVFAIVFQIIISNLTVNAFAQSNIDLTPIKNVFSNILSVGTNILSFNKEADNAYEDERAKEFILYGQRERNCIYVNWTKFNGVASYSLYRAITNGGQYKEILSNTSKIYFEDNDINASSTYYYMVKAFDEKGKEIASTKEIEVISNNQDKYFHPDGDNDNDGIKNEEELLNGTNIDVADSQKDPDNDGITNYDEIKNSKTNAYKNESEATNKIFSTEPIDTDSVVTKEIKSEDNLIKVEVNGDKRLNDAKLEIGYLQGELANSLKGVIGTPVDITSGDTPISSARITMKYDIDQLEGVYEDDLVIYWLDEENEKLVPISDIKVDKVNKTVSGTTPHFSTYLLGSKLTPTDIGMVDVVFAVDQSLSMDFAKSKSGSDSYHIQLVQKLVNEISEINSTSGNIRMGIVEVSDIGRIVTKDTSNSTQWLTKNKTVLDNAIKEIKGRLVGSTNILDGIWVSKSAFDRYTSTNQTVDAKRRKIVVLITDGKDNSYKKEDILKVVDNINKRPSAAEEQQYYNNITIHTVGVGKDFESDAFRRDKGKEVDSEFLKGIAEKTGGSYNYIFDNPEMSEDDIKLQYDGISNKIIKQIALLNKTEMVVEQEDVLRFGKKYTGIDYEEIRNLYTKANINLLTGNYINQVEDIRINSTGQDLYFERTYNSDLGTEKGTLGYGWRSNYDTEVKELEATIGYVTASGLNVRTDTNTSAKIITAISRYTKVSYVGDEILVGNNKWRKVKIPDGREGYVAGLYEGNEYVRTLDTNAVEVTYPSGTRVVFEAGKTDTEGKFIYETPKGLYDKLFKKDNTYYLTKKDNTTFCYYGNESTIDKNLRGKLKSIIDSSNNEITLYYYKSDAKAHLIGKLEKVSDAVGRSLLFEYDEAGKLSVVNDCYSGPKDPTQLQFNERYIYEEEWRSVRYNYNGENLISVNMNLSTEKLISHYTKYEYYDIKDQSGTITGSRLKKIIDGNGNQVIKNDYDPFGRTVRQYDANNSVKFHIYKDQYKDENGEIIGTEKEFARYFIDENGNETKLVFNNDFRPIAKYESYYNPQTSKPGYVKYQYFVDLASTTLSSDDILNKDISTSIQWTDITNGQTKYTPENRITMEVITDKKGNSTSYIYDANNNLVQVVHPKLSDTDINYIERYVYNEFNSLLKQKDKAGEVVSYQYDVETVGLFKFNRLKKVIDPVGNETVYTYQPLVKGTTGNPDSAVKINGLVSSMTIYKKDASNELLEFGKTSYSYFSPYNNRDRVIDGFGNITLEKYDGAGRLREITDPRGNTTKYSVDYFGNILSETDPYGKSVIREYDNAGNLEFFTDKNGHVTKYNYYPNNKLKSKVDANSNTTTYRYDGAGNVISIINENGGETIRRYDSLNRLVRETNPTGYTTTYEYDMNNNLTKVTSPLNLVTVYEYDKLNRKVSETIQSNPAVKTSYTYDCKNNIDTLKDPMGKVSKYKYDKLNRLISVIDAYDPKFIDSKGTITGPKDDLGNLTGNIETKTEYAYEKQIKGVDTEHFYVVTAYDPKGNFTVKSYDIFSNLREEKDSMLNTMEYTYDKVGNLVKAKDKRGNVTEYAYDKVNRRIKETDANGKYIQKKYDGVGNPVEITDKKGSVTLYTYDKLGRLVKITDPLKATTLYEYDGAGNLISLTDTGTYEYNVATKGVSEKPGTRKTNYYYDEMNRLIQEEVENGEEKDSKYYMYDGKGNLTSETDWENHPHQSQFVDELKDRNGESVFREITRYRYDELNRLVKVEFPAGEDDYKRAAIEHTYDIVGNKLSTKDAKGYVTKYEYDKLCRLVTETRSGDESIAPLTVSYQYDVTNALIRKTLMDRVNLYVYDKLGRLISETEKKSDNTQEITKQYTYDQNGNVISTKLGDRLEEKTYDKLNQLTAMSVKGLKTNKTYTTRYSYDDNGNITEETDWLGNKFSYEYDELNRMKAKRDPDNIVIETSQYHPNGLLWKSTDALGHVTQYYYDRQNRLELTIDPTGIMNSQKYNADGNLISITDGNLNTTSYKYDSLNRLIKVTGANGDTSEYTYDYNGNMNTYKNGKGDVTKYDYNAANLLAKRIDNGGTGDENDPKTEFYSYYGDGSLKEKKDRNKNITTYEYDCHSRMVTEETKGTSTIRISNTYDIYGNLLTTSNGSQTITRSYDESGRVVTKNVTGLGTTTYSYDIISGVDVEKGFVAETATYPDASSTTKVFDKAGRLKYVKDGDIGASKIAAYEYYGNGALNSITYHNNSTGKYVEKYTYYANGLLQKLTNEKAGGEKLDEYTYSYDGAGNQISKSEVINGQKYGDTGYKYDELNRLVKVTEPSGRTVEYTYDKGGNREREIETNGSKVIRSTYTYDGQNRLTQILKEEKNSLGSYVQKGTSTYTYDNNGNQTMVETLTDGIKKEIVNNYNVLNQLTMTTVDGQTVGIYTYNPEGLRVSKRVGSTLTRYLYEYDKVILEFDGAGKATGRNIYGNNLLMRKADGMSLYYMYNGHGDVTALIDASNGVTRATYYYDAFGNVQKEKYYTASGSETATPLSNSIMYAGYQYDKETGLYYCNARMYDPKVARFLQEDTYRGDPKDPLSLNLYTYCVNNPLIYYDPTGHDPNKMSYHIYQQGLGSSYNFIPGYYPTASTSKQADVIYGSSTKKSTVKNQAPAPQHAPSPNKTPSPHQTPSPQQTPNPKNSQVYYNGQTTYNGKIYYGTPPPTGQTLDVLEPSHHFQVGMIATGVGVLAIGGFCVGEVALASGGTTTVTYIANNFDKAVSYFDTGANVVNTGVDVANGNWDALPRDITGTIESLYITKYISAQGKTNNKTNNKDAAEIVNGTKQTGDTKVANGKADASNYAELKKYYSQIGEHVPQRDGHYSGNLVKAKQADVDADLLGQRLNGESRVYFQDDLNYSKASKINQYEQRGAREFDVVSNGYIAQTKPNTVSNSTEYRRQVYATFDAAKQNGKLPYFHFEGGMPSNEIIDVLNNYSDKFGVKYVLDTIPLK